MDDLMSVVDWSRWQFALTAIYHWLFVPLTLGLSVIVGVMETIYFRKRTERWLRMTKFWMLLFGINFAIGVATGITLEFEFGTNWSNYSWFVGDIFGAPLAIEGLLAFFMESTFVAVMFFGWKKVSPRFHLAATWLTAIGATISAAWILIANAWMQYPVGMEFDPEQMRNVMDDFWALVLSPVAINKFFHAVMSGWALAGVFVIGVSCWMLLRRRNREFAVSSIKVGGWVGLIGILLTAYTGDGSAVEVSRCQPMKLAAMEGLYHGGQGQSIVALGVLNPDKRWDNDEEEFLFHISIPKGLSLLAKHDPDAYVPGIADLIEGREITACGDTLYRDSYAERIEIGRKAHEGLRGFDAAMARGDKAAMDSCRQVIKENYRYFGYGYLDTPSEAVPPVAVTFYAFHVMVTLGGYFVLFFIIALWLAYRRPSAMEAKWICWVGILSIPLMWICSEAGWVVAEVGRQPWVIESIMPTRAAISDISVGTVQTTFWLFAAIATVLLVAEMSIMIREIGRFRDEDNNDKDNAK